MLRRWWFLSGVAFAVLLIVGFILESGPTPEKSDAPDADWVKVFSSSGDRTSMIVGGFVMVAAGLLFLWFAATLWTELRGRAGTDRTLATVATATGLLFVAFEMAAAVGMATVAASITFGDFPVPAADFGRQFSQLGIAFLLMPGAWSAAVFVASVSRIGSVAGVFARWMSVFGYVMAVLLLFGFLFLPFLAMPLWAIVMGIALARRPAPVTPAV